jgi:hypothetical protein
MTNTCDRCLGNAETGRWESGWPMKGAIDMLAASQAFAKLAGVTGCADKEHFDWWREGHPAMTINEAQHVRFEWSHDGKFRLCYDCHNKLLAVIGEFFGVPRRVAQLKKVCSPPAHTSEPGK